MMCAFALMSCDRDAKMTAGARIDSQQSQDGADSKDPEKTRQTAIANDPGGGGEGPFDSGGDPPEGWERQIAGPIGDPQSLLDPYLDQINPWGPVISQSVVEISPGQFVTVNRLSSPDPFTGTYQLPNGNILVTNEPLQDFFTTNYNEESPETIIWTAPAGGEFEIAEDEMIVLFKQEVTEQEISNFIAANDLYVIFSWFEGPEEPEEGNSIAWFQFRFTEERFSTFDLAYAYFSTHQKIEQAQPNTMDEYTADYPPPNDTHYTSNKALYINHFFVNQIPQIPYGPEGGQGSANFSDQMVAVIDSGVYRNHPDLNGPTQGGGVRDWHISNIGVDCWDKSYEVGKGKGEPTFIDPVTGNLAKHGTNVAGIISAATNNSIGTASMAPNAKILPIRLKVDNIVDGYLEKFTAGSMLKAIRALRFEFHHDPRQPHLNWREKVRVVNMSFGGGWKYMDWNPPKTMKDEISLDLRRNDRLYVASAGNERKHLRTYPAAHDNVLGVSGLRTNFYGTQWDTGEIGNGSNYFSDNYTTYPVSGIYDFMDFMSGSRHLSTIPFSGYDHFNGTSACAPQVSSLAFHLYRIRPDSTYIQVQARIVNTRRRDLDQTGAVPIAGIANYYAAINGW